MKTDELLLEDLTEKASEIIQKLKRYEVNSPVPKNEQHIEFEGISLDYSRQFIDRQILTNLTKLEQIKNFKKKNKRLIFGKRNGLTHYFSSRKVRFHG